MTSDAQDESLRYCGFNRHAEPRTGGRQIKDVDVGDAASLIDHFRGPSQNQAITKPSVGPHFFHLAVIRDIKAKLVR